MPGAGNDFEDGAVRSAGPRAHAQALPPTVQSLLRTLGRTNAPAQGQGDALLSYLLFEVPYTQALMELGQADAWGQSAEIHRFFGWKAPL